MAQHLTVEERDRIAELNHRGAKQKEIARLLKRSPSTISRELRRNGSGGEYYAGQAQRRAEKRRRERPLTRKMDTPEIREAVCRGLSHYWSPDQIGGRLKLLNSRRCVVSARTIYTWIDSSEDPKFWRSFLRNRGKRGSRSRRPDRIGAPIRQRPQAIEARSRLGDFEGDTVLGIRNSGGLVTLVDRKSRYTIMARIDSKSSDHVYQKIKGRLRKLDADRRRSLTIDNGTEFTRCPRLRTHPGIELYVADPGRPHQRGTNENTNGLIRQFFPRETWFRDVTHRRVRGVEDLLNNRPRACLGYRTPNEVFFSKITPRNCN